ncbi:GCN5-related N-acetyltransferase [Fomitopsis betulina]|nr:GCN5-related N-acetyltransferase [Fomitopsis betulina]
MILSALDCLGFKRIAPEGTIPLRHTVLWPNHPVSHVLLSEDQFGFHYGAFSASRETPVAVISIFKEPLPTNMQEGVASEAPTAVARFRKFACEPSYQGHGIGSKLLQHAFSVASGELGCKMIWCDARLATAGWYERRGMTLVGSVFYKEDIPYVRMQAPLTH